MTTDAVVDAAPAACSIRAAPDRTRGPAHGAVVDRRRRGDRPVRVAPAVRLRPAAGRGRRGRRPRAMRSIVADRCPPDLVILDVDLGRGDAAGVDLARILLERHRGRAGAGVDRLPRPRGHAARRAARRPRVRPQGRRDRRHHPRRARAAARGERVRSARPVGGRPDVLRDENRPPARGFGGAMLTERENQVFRLLAVGMSNREIGAPAGDQRGHREVPRAQPARQARGTAPDRDRVHGHPPGHRLTCSTAWSTPASVAGA